MSSGSPQALPKVSIITVVYNNVAELGVTMDSIKAQTYPNIEYLIIDGGSTDGTLELIKEREAEVTQWISEPDKGLYDAMNKGQKMATGDFVWFMNSGDLIESPDTLQQVFEIDGLTADIYYGETNLIDETGKILGTRSKLTTRKLPVELTWRSFKYGNVVSHQSLIVRKVVAEPYDLSYPCSADIEWEVSAFKNAKQTVNINGIMSRFLVGGYSSQRQPSCWQERIKIFLKHYGLVQTVLVHIYFVFRAAKFSLFGAKM